MQIINNVSNLNLIKEQIENQDISFIDIRFINKNGLWQGLSFLSKNFNFQLLDGLNFEGISLAKINTTRYFIDPFLAHKTLVFLTDDIANFKHLTLKNNNENYIKLVFNIFEENINTQNNALNTLNNELFLTPPFDNSRDIRAEIVQTLIAMNVPVYTHYLLKTENEKSNHIIMVENSSKINNFDTIQKVKYAILMVAKAYKIKIDANSEIFTKYKNPYEAL